MPAISVLMGFYNEAKYLPEALDSILAQTFQDFEIILVDDGSTDASRSIADAYALKDSRIRVFHNQNQGLTKSLNFGVEHCTAKYIARMDADDISLPERFARQVEFMEANPDVICSGTGVMLMDPYGVPVRPVTEVYESHQEIVAGLYSGVGTSLVHPSIIMRADILQSCGGYNSKYRTAQDLDLYLRLAEKGRLANILDILLCYRQHLASTNSAKREMQMMNREAIVREASERRGQQFDPVQLACWPPLNKFVCIQDWGWNALRNGKPRIALRHSLHAFRYKPVSRGNLKLIAVSAIRSIVS